MSILRALAIGTAIGFAGGAGLETFMVLTGFYKVATRKAAEHRVEDHAMLQAAAGRRRRLADLRPTSHSIPEEQGSSRRS
jgi:hypothetical protein